MINDDFNSFSKLILDINHNPNKVNTLAIAINDPKVVTLPIIVVPNNPIPTIVINADEYLVIFSAFSIFISLLS